MPKVPVGATHVSGKVVPVLSAAFLKLLMFALPALVNSSLCSTVTEKPSVAFVETDRVWPSVVGVAESNVRNGIVVAVETALVVTPLMVCPEATAPIAKVKLASTWAVTLTPLIT